MVDSRLTRDWRLTWVIGWLMPGYNSFVDHTVEFFSEYSGCPPDQHKTTSIPKFLHEKQQTRLMWLL